MKKDSTGKYGLACVFASIVNLQTLHETCEGFVRVLSGVKNADV
jgi:hypothetical protein